MINEIVKEVRKQGYEVTSTVISKNGIEKQGIIIGSGVVRPTIYVDDFLKAGLGIPEIVQEVICIYEKSTDNEMANNIKTVMNDLSRWDYAKNHLQLCLQPKTTENIVKRDFLDLEMYVRVFLPVNEEDKSLGGFKITPEILHNFQVSEDELFSCAISALKNQVSRDSFFGMPILTNHEKVYGASVICDDALLEEVAEEFDSSFVIIPSSIHEVIIMETSSNDVSVLEDFNRMVEEVNEAEVLPEERLCNHAYLYDREAKVIKY